MISNQKLIDDIWNYFNTQLMNVIDNNIPSKICGGRTRTPCITRDIKHMLHKKHRLFQQARKTKYWKKLPTTPERMQKKRNKKSRIHEYEQYH